jgi:hypothetical protein
MTVGHPVRRCRGCFAACCPSARPVNTSEPVGPSTVTHDEMLAQLRERGLPLELIEHLRKAPEISAAVAVGVCRIDEGDPGRDRGIDHEPCPFGIQPATEIVAAQSES